VDVNVDQQNTSGPNKKQIVIYVAQYGITIEQFNEFVDIAFGGKLELIFMKEDKNHDSIWF